MAKSLNEYYQEVVEAKEAQAALSALNAEAGENMDYFVSLFGDSKVSIWRLWAFISAFYLWFFAKNNEVLKEEVEYKVALKQSGTLKWYQDTTLNYLFGKPFIYDNTTKKYVQELLPTDDEELLKIVKYCATTKAPNEILIKVATDNGGIPGTLSIAQVTALSAFLDGFEFAGDNLTLVNNSADKLNIDIDVYVDPLVINLTTGELLAEPGVEPAKDAIDFYLQNLYLEFNNNARFKRTKFVDYIQASKGVTDIHISTLQSKYGTFAYSDIEVSVIPNAGYFEIENLNITYKAAEV